MKKVIFFLMVCCLMSSCTKTDECSKNCVDVRIKGQVKNMEDNVGIPNVPVTIAWNSYNGWLGLIVIPIAKGNTDKFGNYDFLVAIDNSLFGKNYILTSIPLDSNFLYLNCSTKTDAISYNITSSSSSTFLFELFPKAILTLKIYPSNSTFKGGQVGYSFTKATSNYTHYWSKSNNLQNYLLKFDTRANVFTKIFWAKYDALGVLTEYKDSLICKKNVENIFQITF